jgi:hypothetical protein
MICKFDGIKIQQGPLCQKLASCHEYPLFASGASKCKTKKEDSSAGKNTNAAGSITEKDLTTFFTFLQTSPKLSRVLQNYCILICFVPFSYFF